MKEMRASMIDVRRRERLNDIWNTERDAIKSLLHVEEFDDRVLLNVLRTHLDERTSAMRELEKVRQILAAPGDPRSLPELLETMVRRR